MASPQVCLSLLKSGGNSTGTLGQEKAKEWKAGAAQSRVVSSSKADHPRRFVALPCKRMLLLTICNFIFPFYHFCLIDQLSWQLYFPYKEKLFLKFTISSSRCPPGELEEREEWLPPKRIKPPLRAESSSLLVTR